MSFKVLVCCLLVSIPIHSSPIHSEQNLTAVTIVHINDFHARFEETDSGGAACKNPTECIGGYARVVTVVKRLLEEFKDQHVLYLNAGDNYQGL